MNPKDDGGPVYPQEEIKFISSKGHDPEAVDVLAKKHGLSYIATNSKPGPDAEITPISEKTGGLTKRDWFAGRALSNPQTFDEAGGGTRESAAKYLGIEVKDYDSYVHFPKVIAKACYEYADAMIAEMRKREKP